MDDIDLDGFAWQSYSYSGIFDGQGYTISNYSHSGSFFSSVSNATIKNVNFENLIVAKDDAHGVSGLTSYATNSIFENVHINSGNIYTTDDHPTNGWSSGTSSGNGGLIGYAENCVVERCSNAADINGGIRYDCGGLIGEMASTTIINSYATGNVTNRPGNTGGLVGYMGSGTIKNSYFSGTVTSGRSTASDVGCLVGDISSGEISGCYNTGTISFIASPTGPGYGGLAGSSGSSSKITNSYYNKANDTIIIDALQSCHSFSAVNVSSVESAIEDIKNGTSFVEVSNGTELKNALLNKQNIRLACDINLTDVPWTTISNYNGILDGAGFTISNLTYSEGLIASTAKGAVIKNPTRV